MGIKTYNPYTPSRRNMTGSDFAEPGWWKQKKIQNHRLQEKKRWYSGNCNWYRVRSKQNC